MQDLERATDALLVRGIFPVWLAAGAFDWYCHRQTKIEKNAGTAESVMHLLMGFEAGAGLLTALLFKTNRTSFSAVLAAAAVHELTTIWDVGYTAPRREIKPREQHAHSFLEVLPFVIAGLMAIRPWTKSNGFHLRKTRPSAATLSSLIFAAAAFGVLPHVEELMRCIKTDRGERAAKD